MTRRQAIAGATSMAISCICAGQLTNDAVLNHHYWLGCVFWVLMVGCALCFGWFTTEM